MNEKRSLADQPPNKKVRLCINKFSPNFLFHSFPAHFHIDVGQLRSVGRTKSRKPCYRLVSPTVVDTQYAETRGRMCCGRPKSVNWVVMDN